MTKPEPNIELFTTAGTILTHEEGITAEVLKMRIDSARRQNVVGHVALDIGDVTLEVVHLVGFRILDTAPREFTVVIRGYDGSEHWARESAKSREELEESVEKRIVKGKFVTGRAIIGDTTFIADGIESFHLKEEENG